MRYRHLRRTVIAVLAAGCFVLVLGLLAQRVLDSRPVRQTVVRWLEARADRMGVRLTVRSLRWGLLPPRLRLSGVTAESRQLQVEADDVELALAGVRIAQRTVELGTVLGRGIRVRLLDVPRRAPQSDRAQVRLVVRQLDLCDVEFEGRELPGKLALTLDGVTVAWVTEEQVPKGYLAAERARLAFPNLEPIDLRLAARLEMRDGLELPSLRIRGDGIRLDGRGRLSGAEGVVISAVGSLDLAELDHVVKTRGALSGTARVVAELDTRRQRLLEVTVTSNAMTAARIPIHDLRGVLAVERDRLYGVVEQAHIWGGTIAGSYELAGIHRPSKPHRVEVHGASVALERLLGAFNVPRAGLASLVAADGVLEWDNAQISAARGRGTARLRPTAEPGLPVSGTIDFELNGEGLLRFASTGLAIGGSTVDWQGPLTMGSWDPAWSVTASPAVLEEVIPLINAWVGDEVLPTSVTGLAELQVDLAGSWRRLTVTTRIDARPLRYDPLVFDQVMAEGTIAGSMLQLGPSRFTVGSSHGELEGSIAWGDDAGEDQLQLTLRGHRLPLDRLAGWVGFTGPASGAISFTGGLRGAIAAPRGSWAVGIDDGSLFAQPLGDGSVSVDLAQGRFELHSLSFDRGLTGDAWWDVVAGDVGGNLSWRAMPVAMLGDAVARLAGGSADLDLEFLLPRDRPASGRIEAVSPNARLDVAADGATVTAELSAAGAVSASTRLEHTADGGLAGPGELRLASAQRLLTRWLPDSNLPLEGSALARFAVHWPRDGSPRLEGHLQDLDLVLGERPIALLAPAPFTLSERGLELAGLSLRSMDDELFARWSIAPDGALAGNLSGTMDALLLRFLIPDWEPAGRATGVIELLGTVDRPQLEGIADVQQGSFRLPQTQTILSGISGTLLFSSEELILDGMDFRYELGNARCSGRVALRDGSVQLNLAGAVSSLRYEVFPGLIAYLSGVWELEGPADNLDLIGDVTVDGAALRRKDDVTAILLDWFGTPTQPRPGGGLSLDLHVEADETIDIRNPFVRLLGSGSLDITGTIGQPGIAGKIEFGEGGELTLQTIRYELERFSLTFADPSSIAPFIEFQARTSVENYEITIHLAGTPDRLVPSVASSPPLSEGEIYSMLALGYRDETLGGGAMGIGLASSMLTRQLTAELDRRARTLLPIDQILVDPFAATSTQNPTARISVVKQLNPSWTFIVQSNLAAERQEAVISRWYLAPGLFVEASRDIDGAYGIDLKLRRPY